MRFVPEGILQILNKMFIYTTQYLLRILSSRLLLSIASEPEPEPEPEPQSLSPFPMEELLKKLRELESALNTGKDSL
ncbi:MAG: hypothetical protein Greene041662_985 [Candidatus Peregrinibacteria bacterium Greene0416_62]|nr:MAG: hypothetical protein Greene041662_985 [Candidatus Peregrinibacteria bacterium Greene0416_62]TSC98758.1 MAG: hypothetical protein Greene101449_861 [Candidatus Peregrinibacteria bacterium Greene1014_49]